MTQCYNTLLNTIDQTAKQIKLHAPIAENFKKYPEEFITGLKQKGIFKGCLPKIVGGCVEQPEELIELLEKTAFLDGSFGWLNMVFSLAGINCALYLDDKGVENVFGENADVLIAGQYFANGTGVETDGGVVVTGNWMFGSGAHHADWFVGGFVTMVDGKVKMRTNNEPDIKVAVLPKHEINLGNDWNVSGLQATGSVSFNCEKIFVPDHMIFSFSAPQIKRGQDMHQVALMTMAAVAHGSWALGMARRILEDTLNIAKTKTRASEKSPLAYKETFQLDYGVARAKLKSAHFFLLEQYKKAIDLINHDGKNIAENDVRLAATHATDTAVQICEMAQKHIGFYGTRLDGHLQRFFRDVQSGRQHMVVSPQTYINTTVSILSI